MTILNERHGGGTGKPPSERRDWDVQAAFTRLAGADVDGFRKAISERAAQYCTEQDQHLSFEEVQAAVADGDIPSLAADRQQHFQECSFCQELRDAITPSEVDRQGFVEILKRYENQRERAIERDRDRGEAEFEWQPVFARASGAVAMSPSRAAHPWTLGMGALLVGAVLGVLVWTHSGLHMLMAKGDNPGGSAGAAKFDWAKASSDCKADSQHAQGCDLLVAAAALTSDGKPAEARPIFVRGLREAGVHETTVARINEVLATQPAADKTLRKKAAAAADNAVAESKEMTPEKLLAAAKLEFVADRPLVGYERLGTYAAHVAAGPETVSAVQIAFVQPMREIREARHVSQNGAEVSSAPTDIADVSDSSADSAAAAAAAAAAKP
jgi:hypothetical protein